MSARCVGPRLAGARRRPWLCVVALAVLVVQVACATGAPSGSGLGGYSYRPLMPRGSTGSPQAPVGAWGPEGGGPREEIQERVRQVEQARAALVLAAQREGRNPEAAHEAEVDRAQARVVGLSGGVEEVGAVLAFTYWVEGGALTPVGYQEERGSGRAGRPVDAGEMARMLRRVFTEYMGQRAGEGVLWLRREESRWVAALSELRNRFPGLE